MMIKYGIHTQSGILFNLKKGWPGEGWPGEGWPREALVNKETIFLISCVHDKCMQFLFVN